MGTYQLAPWSPVLACSAAAPQVKSAVSAAGGKLELWWGPTMYHLDDLPFR